MALLNKGHKHERLPSRSLFFLHAGQAYFVACMQWREEISDLHEGVICWGLAGNILDFCSKESCSTM